MSIEMRANVGFIIRSYTSYGTLIPWGWPISLTPRGRNAPSMTTPTRARGSDTERDEQGAALGR
jgi:hypothetical protein